ncbi:MAG: LPS export ABC transporter periplasmic protein LptC [Acetobacteraceae bacterium]|nr:LPS export ABC transporter periplasmic protein LptC [Acetobacteraceae bacterium]
MCGPCDTDGGTNASSRASLPRRRPGARDPRLSLTVHGKVVDGGAHVAGPGLGQSPALRVVNDRGSVTTFGLSLSINRVLPIVLAFGALSLAPPAFAQQIDFSRGGPIDITAQDGIEWRQNQQEVIARGNARAVRGNVTVTADQLIAWYRKKSGSEQAQPVNTGLASDTDTAGNEIYRVQAEGHVHITTPTDHAEGDQAVYDIDQAVMIMTGSNLRLTTPTQVLTARDDMEYWSQKHMAVARGDAVVVTNDDRRLAADTLVAYTTDADTGQPANAAAHPPPSPADDPLASSGKLQKVEAYDHVSVRTPTDTVTGDRAVYVPETGIARVGGNVRITRGQNQLNGSEAEVNLKTGISHLLAAKGGRVQGLVVPNDTTNQQTNGVEPMLTTPQPGKNPAR